MMHFLQLLGITAAVFCTVDALWLYCVINRFCIQQISHLMVPLGSGFVMHYPSVILAYALLVFGLTWFVVKPFLYVQYTVIFLNGALFGLCMYGIYEFTNHATLRGWPLSFLTVDVVWGTFWCGMASVIAIFVAHYFFKF